MHGSKELGAQCGRWEPLGNWGYVLGLLGKCNRLEKGYIWSWSVCVFAYIRTERAEKKYVGNFLGNIKIKDKTSKHPPHPPPPATTSQVHSYILAHGFAFCLGCCQYLDLLDHVAQLYQELLGFFGPVWQPVQRLGELALQRQRRKP